LNFPWMYWWISEVFPVPESLHAYPNRQ
jgi:hypothetical protein